MGLAYGKDDDLGIDVAPRGSIDSPVFLVFAVRMTTENRSTTDYTGDKEYACRKAQSEPCRIA